MREGVTPPATGLLFIDGSSFINFKCFFFYLPHCQDLINIHEFPALEYLSSCEEEGSWQREGKERVPGGIRRVSQWGERGSLWVFFLALRLSFQATAGKTEKAGRQDGVLPASDFILLW